MAVLVLQRSPKANHENEERGLHAKARAVPAAVPVAVPVAVLVPDPVVLAGHLEPSLRPSSHSPALQDSVQHGSALTREHADATNGEQRNIKIQTERYLAIIISEHDTVTILTTH